MNRQDLANEMFGLGDGYDDSMVDLASEITSKLIDLVETKKWPAEEVIEKLMERVDKWIRDRNFDAEEDARWTKEHGL